MRYQSYKEFGGLVGLNFVFYKLEIRGEKEDR